VFPWDYHYRRPQINSATWWRSRMNWPKHVRSRSGRQANILCDNDQTFVQYSIAQRWVAVVPEWTGWLNGEPPRGAIKPLIGLGCRSSAGQRHEKLFPEMDSNRPAQSGLRCRLQWVGPVKLGPQFSSEAARQTWRGRARDKRRGFRHEGGGGTVMRIILKVSSSRDASVLSGMRTWGK